MIQRPDWTTSLETIVYGGSSDVLVYQKQYILADIWTIKPKRHKKGVLPYKSHTPNQLLEYFYIKFNFKGKSQEKHYI